MNILYICHRIPYPPNKGDKIRSFHQIRHLSKEHAVHLACLVDDKDDLKHVKTLDKYCASVDMVYRNKSVARFLAVKNLFTHKPLSVASFYSHKLKKKLAKRLNSGRFDRIVVFSSTMAEYIRRVSDIPKIIDFLDVDSEKWRIYADHHPFMLSQIYRLEADRLARYEEEIAMLFDHSIFVSEEEARLFKQRLTSRPISVIPNGVDFDYFTPIEGFSLCSNQSSIVFTGAMDYFPNVDAVKYFCGEIFPLVREALPEAWFYIVGRNPTRQVRELGRQPNVTVTGSVSDVRPYIAKAKVAVAPFRIARGVQNKILEAMAMGVPVVGTPEAFKGIQATVADGIRIANDPKSFAREVLIFCKNLELRQQCSRQARHYVQHHHRWQDHGARLESLLQEITVESASHIGAQVGVC